MSKAEEGSTLWHAQRMERIVNLGIDSMDGLLSSIRELSAAVAHERQLNDALHKRRGDGPIRWHRLGEDHAALISGISAVNYATTQYAKDHPFVFDEPLVYEKPDIEVGRIFCGEVVATMVITHREGKKPMRLWVFGERKSRE